MANKFTISANFTVTSTKRADEVIADVYAALQSLGSNCIVQQTNCNQWVDQVTSTAQTFNDDGTPVVQESADDGIVETVV